MVGQDIDMAAVAAVIAGCDGAVMVDTGPAHIAAAAGIPVAVLSCHPRDGLPGAPLSPLRYAPLGARVLVLQPDTAVAPCKEMCVAERAHCITAIDPDHAAAAIAAFFLRG